jgi:kinetochor protein Mis14/NSL1
LSQVIQEEAEEEGVDGEGDETEEKVEEQAGYVEGMEVDTGAGLARQQRRESRRRNRTRPDPEWKLDIPLGTEEETERWRSGDMADVYENALRTLQRLQGEGGVDGEDGEGNALATTVGKAERAGRAAEVVESM